MILRSQVRQALVDLDVEPGKIVPHPYKQIAAHLNVGDAGSDDDRLLMIALESLAEDGTIKRFGIKDTRLAMFMRIEE